MPPASRSCERRLRPLPVDEIPVSGLLHLLSGVTYLGRGTLLAVKEMAGRPEFQGMKVLVVPDDEAYACNVLALGDCVVAPAGYHKTIALLSVEGFEVLPVPVTEFTKADGGVTCLSLVYRGAGLMPQRLVDLYAVGEHVEILQVLEEAEVWRSGEVAGHQHPAIWVRTDGDRKLWFVTNGKRIRRARRRGIGLCLHASDRSSRRATNPRSGANTSASRKKAVHTSTIAAPDATLT